MKFCEARGKESKIQLQYNIPSNYCISFGDYAFLFAERERELMIKDKVHKALKKKPMVTLSAQYIMNKGF